MVYLKQAIKTFQYPSNKAVFAITIGGIFCEKSEAKEGDLSLHNGGLDENYKLVATSDEIEKHLNEWYEEEHDCLMYGWFPAFLDLINKKLNNGL
jgi:hypothetical protein